MYNGNIIKQLLLDKKVTNKELLRYLGTEANASLAQIVNGNPTVKRLEKVADFFGVSMDVFFEREKPFKAYSSAHGDNEQQYKEKIELLERLLEEKDKRILLLEQMNQLVNPTESRTDLGQTIYNNHIIRKRNSLNIRIGKEEESFHRVRASLPVPR